MSAVLARLEKMSYTTSVMLDTPPTLSPKEFVVLDLLIARGALYGLELVEQSDGELKRGTVYVTLSRMTDKGYVSSSEQDAAPGEQGPPRRRYTVTGFGARVYKANRAAVRFWQKGLAPA